MLDDSLQGAARESAHSAPRAYSDHHSRDRRGQGRTARPVTVVRDTPELLVLYIIPGTVYKHPRLPDQDVVPTFLLSDAWRLVDLTWTGGGAHT